MKWNLQGRRQDQRDYSLLVFAACSAGLALLSAGVFVWMVIDALRQ